MHRGLLLPTLLLAALSLAAEPQDPTPAPQEAPTTGAIAGGVRFVGDSSEGQRFDIELGQRPTCGYFKRVLPYQATKGALRDVVVGLAPEARAPRAGAAIDRVLTLTMRRCEWSAQVSSATQGQVLSLVNRDPAPLFPLLRWERPPEAGAERWQVQRLSVPGKDQQIAVVLKGTGALHLSCGEGRPWADATLWVFPHDWHTVSDDKGAFLIAQVPPGRHEVMAWHPTLGESRTTVDVEVGRTSSISFTFSPQGPAGAPPAAAPVAPPVTP